jgi:hypothetical protein
MATNRELSTTYVDLYDLLGKTPDTEIAVQVVDGAVYIDEEVTPTGGYLFKKGEWAYIKAPQAWIKSVYGNSNIIG